MNDRLDAAQPMGSRGVSAPRCHWTRGLKAAEESHVGAELNLQNKAYGGCAQTWLMFISDKGNHLSSPRSATITQMLIGRRAGVLCKRCLRLKMYVEASHGSFNLADRSIGHYCVLHGGCMCVGGKFKGGISRICS